MKKLPLSRQHFEPFSKEGLIYVDKTQLIHALTNENRGYFLSRPRRFGKSLLVDTIQQLFLGRQALFQGLWIYDKIEWKTHPVIHIDFSLLDFYTFSLEEALSKHLDSIAKKEGVVLEAQSAKSKFSELITTLSKKGKVVVLIDEYDKPITDYITDISKADANREVLRNFFGVLKPLGIHLRFLFITGITKYSRVSLFSVLNNLTDITMSPKYASITGITHRELLFYFKDYIKQVQQKFGVTEAFLLDNIKNWYDGYSWDGETLLYNPFSLLSFFDAQEFENYWFRTGTPSFLIKFLKQYKVSADELEGKKVFPLFFDSFELKEKLDIYPLMFQTGYSTVKAVKRKGLKKHYILGFPNYEVRQSFIGHLIHSYTDKSTSVIGDATLKIEEALEERSIADFRIQLNVLLSDISYRLFPIKQTPDKAQQEFVAWEGYFHTIVYLILQYVGLKVKCEVSKKHGQLDAIVEVEDYLYIMEFKLGEAKDGLLQIHQNKYAHSYVNSKKQIILMGIAFDRQKKEVKQIEWEIWDKKFN